MIPPFLGRFASRYALSIALLLFLFLPSLALAQKGGSITGVLVDAASGETLIGANVRIDATTVGSTTDFDGRYEIEALEPGVYTVIFSYIGYNSVTVEGVEVFAGETTRIDLALEEEAIMMEDVVVEARALRDSEAVLLRDRQKALAVSDAISAQAISRSGSSDAADAMEKVTGASVVAGKYVYVRGLGERYANTQLNGAELASSDPDRKAVQFDLFPSNLLDNIVTIKTFTPDKPGNFSGGLVDIGTKSFPDNFTFQFSVSSSLNSETNFGADVLSYDGGERDWLGEDDGTRAVPNALTASDLVIPSQTEAFLESARTGDNTQALELDRLSKSFNNTMGPTVHTAPVNQSYSMSVGNKAQVGGNPLGYIVGITYDKKTSYYDGGETGRYSFGGTQSTSLNADLILSDAKGVNESSLGGLANLTYRLGANNEIGFNVLYSRSGESSTLFQEGTWPKELSDDPNSRFINRTLQYAERELATYQLRGEHLLGALNNAKIEWTAAYSDTKQDQPDIRFFAHTERLIGQNTILTTKASGFRDPSRLYRNLDENNADVKLDLTLPFKQWIGQNSNFKFGGAYQRSERDFQERAFSITPNQQFDGNAFTYFAPENMGIVGIDTLSNGNLGYTFGNVVVNRSKPRNNYTGERTIAAGYGMLELPLSRRLKFIGGVRLESTILDVVSQDSTQGIGDLDNLDLLPSANLVFQLTDNMNVRAAVTRTLARPTFREIAPFESFEFINGSFFIGNPDLERTLITNGDLRWEWFMRPGEIVALSLFYKKLFDPIERTIIGGTNGQIQFQNVDEAEVLGAELEFRTGLDRFASFLRNVSVGSNLSFVRSNIDIPQTELDVRRGIDPNAEDTRELQGQSPYLVNVDLSYTNIETGTVAGLYYNVFGKRLSNVSLGGTPDVFERPRPDLDFTFSQRLPLRWKIKLSVKNILGSSYKETYRFLGQDYIYQQYNPGRTFSLGFSYEI